MRDEGLGGKGEAAMLEAENQLRLQLCCALIALIPVPYARRHQICVEIIQSQAASLNIRTPITLVCDLPNINPTVLLLFYIFRVVLGF